MNLNEILTTIPEKDKEPVKVTFDYGQISEYKKISRDSLLKMDAIIPGVKEILNIGTQNLDAIAKLGKTPLFVAVGDASKYTRKADGTVLSSIKDAKGRFAGQPGFRESGFAKEGMTLAAKIGEAIPYVQIVVMVLEIGYRFLEGRKQLIDEEKKMYANHLDELDTDYRMLQQAMHDYYYLTDDASKAGYMGKAIDIFVRSSKRFDDMKNIIGDLNSKKVKISEDQLRVMQVSLIVYSCSCVVKILYSGTQCGDYIKDSKQKIDELTEEYNRYAKKCFEITSQNNAKKKKNAKIATTVALSLLGGTAGAFVGAHFAGEGVSQKMGCKNQKQEGRIQGMRMVENQYAECVSSLYLSSFSKNPILLDEEYVYYPTA